MTDSLARTINLGCLERLKTQIRFSFSFCVYVCPDKRPNALLKIFFVNCTVQCLVKIVVYESVYTVQKYSVFSNFLIIFSRVFFNSAPMTRAALDHVVYTQDNRHCPIISGERGRPKGGHQKKFTAQKFCFYPLPSLFSQPKVTLFIWQS